MRVVGRPDIWDRTRRSIPGGVETSWKGVGGMLGTRPSQSHRRLTPSEAQRLAEEDAAIASARDSIALLDGAAELIVEIDELLVERPFLLAFAQWDGE